MFSDMPKCGTKIDFAGFLSVNQPDFVHLENLFSVKTLQMLAKPSIPEQRYNDFKVYLFIMYSVLN
jgi:hypothetical protein